MKTWLLPLLVVGAGSAFLRAAEPALSNGEIARETSDPTSPLWYLFTEVATSFEPGSPGRKTSTLELQPSLPVLLTPDWRLLNFPDLALTTQGMPDGTPIGGIENFTWLSALGPARATRGISWGLGPYASFPVATSPALGSSQWQFGAGGVVAWRTPTTVVSTILKSGWTTSGPGPAAGALELQYTAQYFFGDGWQAGIGRPRITYSWDRTGEGRWDVPVGLDLARTFRIGRLPIKVMIEYDYFVINDSRWKPEHLFRLTILPVLPSPFEKPIF